MCSRPIRALLAVLGALPCLSATAQPAVRIRGACELRVVARVGPSGPGSVSLSGVLLDELGVPLAGQRVTLRPPGAVPGPGGAATAVTDDQGRFRSELSGQGPDGAIGAAWPGDALHSACEADARVGSARQPAELRWKTESGIVLDLARPTHRVELELMTPGPGSGVPLTLADAQGQTIATSRTGSDGRAVFTLRSDALGAARSARLVARDRGDAGRHPTTATLAVVLRETPALRLEASATAAGQLVDVRGGLTSTSGAPLAGRAVSVLAGGAAIHTLLTDATGGFAGQLPVDQAHRAADGTVELQAVFEPSAPWFTGARSASARIRLAPPSSPSALWLLAPLLLSLWLLRRQRRSEPGTGAAGGAREAVVGRARLGVHRSQAARTRGAHPGGVVTGRVVDVDSGAPLAARLTLSAPGLAPHEFQADPEGAFAAPELPPGTYDLAICCPDYLNAHAELRLPHRGALGSLEIGLRSLRNAAFEHFRPCGDALAGQEGATDQLTPREIARLAKDRGVATQGTAALISHVEQAVFGREPPTRDLLSQLAHDAGEAVPERGGETSAAKDGGDRRATIPHRR